MSVTMLPSGGTVSPTFRPDGKDTGITLGTGTTGTAEQLSQYDWNEQSYMNNLIDKANNGDVASIEKLVDIWATRENEKTARDWTASREDTAYQRLSEDLKKAGISPYVLSGATPMVSSSSGKSVSGSEMTSRANQQSSQSNQNARSVLQLAGIVLAAVLYSLL